MLFDLDGVLVDARPWHRQALRGALAQAGYEITAEQEEALEGLPTLVKLKSLGVNSADIEGIFLSKQRRTLQLIHSLAKPYPDIVEMMARLKGEHKRIGICSNAVRATVYAVMWRTRIVRYIDLVLSNEEAPKPKPNPLIYEMALSCMHAKPEDAVAVEDHPRGVAAAMAAGIRVVTVAGPDELCYERLLEEGSP